MLIYVIRHGETDWNAEGRLQGQQDIPLNETGRRQATGNGLHLARLIGAHVNDFDFVSSPLGRTRETMERLRAAMGLEPNAYRIDDRLREVSFGDWEGLTLPELAASAADRVEERQTSKWDFIPPGDTAESYEILSWRIGAWLSSVDKPTVCVAHGGVIRALFRLRGRVAAEEAANVPTPQDRILKLDGDTIAWI